MVAMNCDRCSRGCTKFPCAANAHVSICSWTMSFILGFHGSNNFPHFSAFFHKQSVYITAPSSNRAPYLICWFLAHPSLLVSWLVGCLISCPVIAPHLAHGYLISWLVDWFPASPNWLGLVTRRIEKFKDSEGLN